MYWRRSLSLKIGIMIRKLKASGICLFISLLFFSCAQQASKKPTNGSPNVLFIAIDDLNDWLGTLEGHPQALTPHMDRLFSQGIVFTNAHCSKQVLGHPRF